MVRDVRAMPTEPKRIGKPWDVVNRACNTLAAGFSVVCMSSMGAALTAASAAAGATGMAGMVSVSAQSGPGTSIFFARFFESIGLGVLNQIPNNVAQPLLAVVLAVSIGAAYLAFRGHKNPGSLVLTLISAFTMYVSIYVRMSELLYLASLIGLIAASIWGFLLARGQGRIRTRS